ncbi:MAG: hypothetical protein NZ556_04520 [Fimbriimonadales bacterium]|nr:hypothetical protein [Fimbriimonadales bacterium]
MRRIAIAMALTTGALLLNGCGGNGGGGGGAVVVATERVAFVRVVDPTTGGAVPGVEVYFVTDTGALQLRRVVASATPNPNEISLSVARSIRSDAREGDFILRNIGDNLFFRGLWVKRPAGYTAVLRYTTPQGTRRVIQTPNSATTLAACLAASERAGIVRQSFGGPGVIDFGVIEIFPNNPQIPPPPVDAQCP